MRLSKMLETLGACGDARKWAGNKRLDTAWKKCERPDWMLWALVELGIDRRKLVAITCQLIRDTPIGDGSTVWDLMTDTRSQDAIIVAERWSGGTATDEEMKNVANAAANAAAYAANAANAAAYAANAAAYAAYAAASAANAAAKGWQAEKIRELITLDEVKALIVAKFGE
jgi:hypothetical protein